MKDITSAVVIDDHMPDVKAITNVFSKQGIPTFPVHFETVNSALSLCRGISESQPRIIITDIQVLPHQQPVPQKSDYSTIAACIHALSENIEGPFIVLAWSDKTEHFEELKHVVERYLESRGTGKPFFFGAINKTDCKEQGDYVLPIILRRLNEHLEDKKQIRALLHWEKTVLKSSIRTTNNIINVAGQNLESTLSALGTVVAGDHFRNNESLAINESLINILRDEISKNSLNDDAKEIWKAAITTDDKRPERKIKNGKFELNRLLHIDATPNDSIICPGDVWEITNTQNFFSLITHGNDASSLCKKIKEDIIEADGSTVAKTEKNIKKAQNDNDRITHERKLSSIKDGLIKARNEASVIAIEISPQCDFSNSKKALKTLALGLIIEKKLLLKDKVIIKESESNIVFGFHLNGEDKVLIISSKNIVGLSETRILSEFSCMKKRFRIRESLLHSFIHQISSYNSRIGTASFHI